MLVEQAWYCYCTAACNACYIFAIYLLCGVSSW